jgi:putative SOS response-associated peptidase YedK
LKDLLRPFPASKMKFLEISPRVNRPENNDPDIVRPADSTITMDWFTI